MFIFCCKFKIIILKTIGEVAETRTLLCHMYKTSFWVNTGYVTLAIKFWSELCDHYANAQPIILLCCRFEIIILKTVEIAGTRTLLCHVFKSLFLSNSRVGNLAIIIRPVFCDLYAHAQSVFLLWCKFQTITLKTVGEVAVTRTVL